MIETVRDRRVAEGWLGGEPLHAIASAVDGTSRGVMGMVRALGLPDRLPAGNLAVMMPEQPVAADPPRGGAPA